MEITFTDDSRSTVLPSAHSLGEILSEFDKNVFILSHQMTLNNLLCLFGVVGNMMSLCVFAKQGLTKSMNLSLFAMAVSDVIEIVFQMWHNVCLNPYMPESESNVDCVEIQDLTAGWPRLFFLRITDWITVYITSQRCLSITFPLKFDQMFTAGRTAAILVFIYVSNTESLIPVYFWAYLSWDFDAVANRTKLGTSFRSDQLGSVIFNTKLHSSLGIVAFVLVIIFTSILVFTLKKQSKWRRRSTSEAHQIETISSRERKAVFMVIVVATVQIASYTPGLCFVIATEIDLYLGIGGKRTNVFQAAWSFAFLLHSVNSSINVLLYYKTSTKYKQTVRDIFPRCL